MLNADAEMKKWGAVLDHEGAPLLLKISIVALLQLNFLKILRGNLKEQDY